nr:oxidoreductase-like domain-containing protein [Massilia cavernae]
MVADPPPPEPVQPALEDCCRSGCTPCVFDLYEDAMEHYRKELAAWRLRHPAAASGG